MSEVRLIAGLLAFVIFVTSILVLAGDTYPEVKPTGLDIALITPPGPNDTIQPFVLVDCERPAGTPGGGGGGGSGVILPGTLFFHETVAGQIGLIGCWIGNLLRMVGNFLAQFFDAVIRAAQFTAALIAFRIPALTGDPTLQLINNIIAIPIWFGLAFTTFTIIRSLIPFIRGS